MRNCCKQPDPDAVLGSNGSYTSVHTRYLEAIVIVVRGCCGCDDRLWGNGSESEAREYSRTVAVGTIVHRISPPSLRHC
jgi:hypothetical protein